MYALLGVCGIIGFIVSLVMLIIRAIKKKPIKVLIITLIVSFVAFVIALIITPSSNTEKSETDPTNTDAPINSFTATETLSPAESAEVNETSTPVPTEDTTERDALRQELKTKYDVGTPQKFVRGDTTDKWRIVKVANGTPPSDYAVEYAKAYMVEGDIHFVVNFSLNTTTMFRVTLGTVEVKTTEYVNKEEHDASLIGNGILYTDQFFNIETGEEITVEANPEAGIVTNDELISTVKAVIDGTVGAGERIVDVTFNGENLTIVVDLSGADTSIISARDIALSRIASITDEILGLDDKYYNTWKTITLDFGSVGKATLDKSIVTDHGFGKYFDYQDDILK